MNSQDVFAQTKIINALLSYQQAPAYPRISWCGLGSPSITGFPSILKAEELHTLEEKINNKVENVKELDGKLVAMRFEHHLIRGSGYCSGTTAWVWNMTEKEDVRSKFVRRGLNVDDDEEELSWDVDDDEEDGNVVREDDKKPSSDCERKNDNKPSLNYEHQNVSSDERKLSGGDVFGKKIESVLRTDEDHDNRLIMDLEFESNSNFLIILKKLRK
ncbi:hypothetical protein Tco_1181173 [Tanacetum coccineum]